MYIQLVSVRLMLTLYSFSSGWDFIGLRDTQFWWFEKFNRSLRVRIIYHSDILQIIYLQFPFSFMILRYENATKLPISLMALPFSGRFTSSCTVWKKFWGMIAEIKFYISWQFVTVLASERKTTSTWKQINKAGILKMIIEAKKWKNYRNM